MPRYAIAIADLFENSIDILFKDADNWREALKQCKFIDESEFGRLELETKELDQIQDLFFDMDRLIYVKEIT